MSYSNTLKLMQDFLSATRRDKESFPGIHEDDIPVLEELTDRNIQIYSNFFEDQSEMFAENFSPLADETQ